MSYARRVTGVTADLPLDGVALALFRAGGLDPPEPARQVGASPRGTLAVMKLGRVARECRQAAPVPATSPEVRR